MKVQEVAVGNFIPHPATVVAVNLTTIRTDSGDDLLNTICVQTSLCASIFTVLTQNVNRA